MKVKGKNIDQIFFLIYNYYYKDGNYRNGLFTKFYPWHYTLFVISLGTMLWTILFCSVGLYYLNNKFINSSYTPIFIACYFISFIFYYLYFIKENRYKEIYDDYKDKINSKKIKSFVSVVILVALPLALILVTALIWHSLI